MNWKTIDTAPRDGTEIMLFDGISILSPCSFDDGGWQMYDSFFWGSVKTEPTHWMPLPEKP